MKTTLILSFLLFAFSSFSQYRFVRGFVLNENNEAIPFASIQVFNADRSSHTEMQYGVSSELDGKYELKLENGFYSIVFSAIGYETKKFEITVINKDQVQNVYLKEKSVELEEVTIKKKRRDPAYAIIKQAIENKESNQFQFSTTESNIYIKGVMRPMNREELKDNYGRYAQKFEKDSVKTALRAEKEKNRERWLKKLFEKKDTSKVDSLQKDSVPQKTYSPKAEARMSFAEVYAKRYYEAGKDVKEIREGFKTAGNYWNLFYLTTAEGHFDFYENLVHVEILSDFPIVSPLSKGSALPYKFKLIKSYGENGRYIHHIKVTPRRNQTALFEGEIHILDGSFAIYKIDLKLNNYALNYYDKFRIQQEYEWINDSMWLVNRQEFTYYLRASKQVGNTTVRYSDFEFNKDYGKKFFNNALLITSQEAVDQDSSYWENIRPEPLSKAEIKVIAYRDSLFQVQNSKVYLDSLDSANNTFTPDNIIYNFEYYNREKNIRFLFPTLTDIFDIESILQIGGYRNGLYFGSQKTFKNEKMLNLEGQSSYGYLNEDITYNFAGASMIDAVKPTWIYADIAKEYQFINGSFSMSLEQASIANYYRNEGGYIAAMREIVNGFYIRGQISYSKITSVHEMESYEWVNMAFNNITPLAFDPFNQFETGFRLLFRPKQKYYMEPKRKVILGSKWPEFYGSIHQGIPDFAGSAFNYTKLSFGFDQTITTGVVGESRYAFDMSKSYGEASEIFLARKSFIASDNYFLQHPINAYSLLDTTIFTRDWTFQGHYLHHFNGAILNQIPLFKKLKLKTDVGGSFLYTKEQDLLHVEAFAGISREYKIFGSRNKIGIYQVFKLGNTDNVFDTRIKVGFNTYFRNSRRWMW